MKLVRESLFSSTVRSFCISFFAVIGIVLAFFLVGLVFGAGKSSKAAETSMFDVVIPDTNGRKYTFNSSKPILLRINIDGEIGKPGYTSGDIISILNESVMGPFKNHPIKGILIYMNSPGGIATDSETIFYALKNYAQTYQIPIYTYVDGLCASGGMLIACSSDQILTSSSSIVGSVGTRILFWNVSSGLNKVGVETKMVYAGKDKASTNPYVPWQENAFEDMQDIAGYGYSDFVNIVADARPKLTVQQLQTTLGARVFAAPVAQEYGYTDGSGYQYWEAVSMLAKAANISDNNYQMVELVPKISFRDLVSWNYQNQKLSFSQLIKKNPLLYFKHFSEASHQMSISSENDL